MNTAERFRITASEFNEEETPDVGDTVAITLKKRRGSC